MLRRFLTFDEVAEELAVSSKAQLYALVRRGALPAIKIGGRGVWLIERAKLEEFVLQAYEDTRRFIATNLLPVAGLGRW